MNYQNFEWAFVGFVKIPVMLMVILMKHA